MSPRVYFTVQQSVPGGNILRSRVGLFLLVILLLLPPHAFARTYYIDANDPAANDEGPGTSEEPYIHIEIANYAVVPGDSVVVVRER